MSDAGGQISAHLEKVDVSGQLAIGDNNLQLTVHGGVVNVAHGDRKRDTRRVGVKLVPRAPSPFHGREKELAAISAPPGAAATLVHGPLGAGKTTLLKRVAHLDPAL